MTPPMIRTDALISDCGAYRYSLTRQWAHEGTAALFIMLNPSTADADQDDPTIRRCIAFAQREGHGELHVANLFALRATDPAALKSHIDPIGPLNTGNLRRLICHSRDIIVAWGAHPFARDRVDNVLDILCGTYSRTPLCLGVTKNGHPRHPLYVRGDAPLIPFPMKKDAP